MNVSEFKAWFEGFCEAVDQTPTLSQWNKIKTKIESLRNEGTFVPNLGQQSYRSGYRDLGGHTVPLTTEIMC